MDTEYHYWITGLIAKRSGFSEVEAGTIAHASEFVDYNMKSYTVLDHRGDSSGYSNDISQTMDISKPRSERLHIYPLFHFIPGDPNADTARRKDGKTHLLNTTPDNAFANTIIDAALSGQMCGAETDQLLHSIGIATHAYVDTWAHQNFVGIKDDFNQIGFDLKPNIGHADAGHQPDIPCLIWGDERLADDIVNNKERFMQASEALFAKYCAFNEGRSCSPECSWDVMAKELTEILGPAHKMDSVQLNLYKRHQRYEEKMAFLKEFDPYEWFNLAIDKEANSCLWREGKEQSDWYRFQEAVKKHHHFAYNLISARIAKFAMT